ncbi:MAG: PP2C family protein-serine/threonine phosphatase, partial [Armatimonadota bacterium]
VLAMSDDRVGVCIADVSGRGVVAALHLSLLKYAVHAAAQVHAQPGEIAAQANRILYPHFATLEFELFVGMFFAVLDLRTGQLTYVNAGHVPPFILRGSGEVRELRTGGLVLGVDTLAPYREQAARLEPGDALIVCTDGINGAVNPAGEELTAEDLAREVADMREASAEEIAERLVQRGRAFAGGVVEDDATALVMKRRPVDALEEPGTGPMEPRTDSTGPVHGDGEAR